ncbi:MAG: hypothetical protein L0Y50_04560 [Beijerinckiaceae bacterium]|nr:hypothetical protein [Beijerinckiaceae bacterium]
MVALTFEPSALSQPKNVPHNLNWPCQQILVERISAAAVWSGPPIETVAWQNDQAVAGIVAKLAPRRTPLTQAEHEIEVFAQSQGAKKTERLVAVFAGLFETLNAERAQVIEGLLRFGAKQKELAAKIRAKHVPQAESAGKPPHDPGEHVNDTSARDLDLRLFDERRHSLAFVCETPALIEQRLFALARAVQRNLE